MNQWGVPLIVLLMKVIWAFVPVAVPLASEMSATAVPEPVVTRLTVMVS